MFSSVVWARGAIERVDLAKGLEREERRTFELAPWLAERAAQHADAARAAGAVIRPA